MLYVPCFSVCGLVLGVHFYVHVGGPFDIYIYIYIYVLCVCMCVCVASQDGVIDLSDFERGVMVLIGHAPPSSLAAQVFAPGQRHRSFPVRAVCCVVLFSSPCFFCG